MNVRLLLRLVRLAVFAWWVVIFPHAGVHGQHMNPEKGIWITSADQSYLLRKIELIGIHWIMRYYFAPDP